MSDSDSSKTSEIARTAPKHVLLSGYYGFGNVGDDALCEALVPAMAAAGVEQITIPCGDPTRLPKHDAIYAIGRMDQQAIDAAFHNGAVVFSGGGGLLQNTTSNRSLLYYLVLLILANCRHRPFVLGFQSVGPLLGGWPRWLTGWIVRRAAAISVRDHRSAETLAKCGVPAESIAVSADAAFLLSPPSDEDRAAVAAELPAGRKIALCLRATAHTDQVVAAVVDWWAQAKPDNTTLVLAACCEADHALGQQVAEKLGRDRCVCFPPSGVSTMLALLASCDRVVSERLHPLIFSALCGVPAVGIDYDPKVAGAAADFDLPLAGTDADLSADGIAAALAQLDERGEAESARLLARAAAARETAANDLQRLLDALAATDPLAKRAKP